jgi:WhiB family redox-sensing transcriptional regulator
VPAAIAPSWPDTRTEFWSWRLEGPPDRSLAVLSTDGERARSPASRERAAKAICRGCTVLDVCAAYAVACQEPYGTWAGCRNATAGSAACSSTRSRPRPTTGRPSPPDGSAVRLAPAAPVVEANRTSPRMDDAWRLARP